MIEIVSLDVSNYCSKGCYFCYNKSNKDGATFWHINDLKILIDDCILNGVKALSVGGGEPFEYKFIFELIKYFKNKIFVSITSNGLPLHNPEIWEQLMQNRPDKIHISIHFPEKESEIQSALYILKKLKTTDIKTGVNLLVSANNIDAAKVCFEKISTILSPKQIILVPHKYSNIPTAEQLATVASNQPFQAPSCLTECKTSNRFCSIGFNSSIGFCSYSPSRENLKELSYKGITDALNRINFKTCIPQI